MARFEWFTARPAGAKSFDVRDIVFVLGMAFLGVGAWLIYPAAAFLLIGAIFTTLSLLGVR